MKNRKLFNNPLIGKTVWVNTGALKGVPVRIIAENLSGTFKAVCERRHKAWEEGDLVILHRYDFVLEANEVSSHHAGSAEQESNKPMHLGDLLKQAQAQANEVSATTLNMVLKPGMTRELKLSLAATGISILALVLGLVALAGCSSVPAKTDADMSWHPCWDEERQELLPPLLGDDC